MERNEHLSRECESAPRGNRALRLTNAARAIAGRMRHLFGSKEKEHPRKQPFFKNGLQALEPRRLLSEASPVEERATMEESAWNLSREHGFYWIGGRPDTDPQGNKYFKDKDFIYWIMTPAGDLYFEEISQTGLRARFTPEYSERIEELLFQAKEPEIHLGPVATSALAAAGATDALFIDLDELEQNLSLEKKETHVVPVEAKIVETLSAAGGGERIELNGEPIVVTETCDPSHPTRGHWTEYVLLRPGAGDSVIYRPNASGKLELFLTSPDYPDRDPETEVRIIDGGKLIASVSVNMTKKATDETFEFAGGRKVPAYRLGEFEFHSAPTISVESSTRGLWRGTGNLIVKQKEVVPEKPTTPQKLNILQIPTDIQQAAYDLKSQYGFILDRGGIHDDPFGRVVGKTREDEWVHITGDGTLFVGYKPISKLSPAYYVHPLELLIKAGTPQSELVDLTTNSLPREFPTLESEGARQSLRAYALSITGMEKTGMDLRAIARKYNPAYFAEEPWQDREMFHAMAPQGENHVWAVEGMIGMQLEYLNDVQQGIDAWNSMVSGALVEAYHAELRGRLGMEPLREDFVGFNLSGGAHRYAGKAEKYVGLPHRGLIETMAAAYFSEIHGKHLELAGREVTVRQNSEARSGSVAEDIAQPKRSDAAIAQHLRVLREAYGTDATYAEAVNAYMAGIGREVRDSISFDDVIVRREEVAAPGVNDVVGVWIPTYPDFEREFLAKIENDAAQYDPEKPLVIIFLGSNQEISDGYDEHWVAMSGAANDGTTLSGPDERTPGLNSLAEKLRLDGFQVKVLETGSNPTDILSYRSNLVPKYYAEKWFDALYRNSKRTGGIVTIGYSWGSSRQVTVLDALRSKYTVPILGSVSLDGVNDPFNSIDPGLTGPELHAPTGTWSHIDIFGDAMKSPLMLSGASASNVPHGIPHNSYFIEHTGHSGIDNDPYALGIIYDFVVERTSLTPQ